MGHLRRQALRLGMPVPEARDGAFVYVLGSLLIGFTI